MHRKLTKQEIKDRKAKTLANEALAKEYFEFKQAPGNQDWLKEHGDEAFDAWVFQQDYKNEILLSIKEIRAMQKDDLINYIEQVLEHELLKPGTREKDEESWNSSEKLLYKNLKASQVKELPDKYQSLLGYKDGKRLSRKERDKPFKYRIREWLLGVFNSKGFDTLFEGFFSSLGFLAFFAPILLIIFLYYYLFIASDPNRDINCADPSSNYQQGICDRAYERTYEEKWGRKPGKIPYGS
jgi:hypothetical protein